MGMSACNTGYQQLCKTITVILLITVPCHGLIENLYCGKEICYEVLGVEYEATKTEITKAYRALARKWHPDMHKKKADKEIAQEMFRTIANAYEILKDEESRTDYDYYLEHPEEYYSHYYRYYKTRMAPKVDVRIVIAFTITIISGIQYWSAWNNYNTALAYLITVPKYRMQAQEIAKEEGLLNTSKRKKDKTRTKEELKEEEDEILKKVLEERMDIRGGYQKPTYYDILWVQLVMLPYYLYKYVQWWGRWVWLFWIHKQEYGEEEQQYLIRKYMKMGQGQWNALEDHDIEEFMDKELWVKENFTEWKAQKEEDMKIQMASSGRHKSYRRYLKKGGAGQMTFGPD